MPKITEMTTPLSEFRRAAAKALRENKQNETEPTDPPVEFYLVSNLVINGNPKSTLEQLLQAQADKLIELTTNPELDTAKPQETVATDPPSDSIPVAVPAPVPVAVSAAAPATVSDAVQVLETDTLLPLPVAETVTPIPNSIPQTVTPDATVAAEPLLISETAPRPIPIPPPMPNLITIKPPPHLQSKKENTLPPLLGPNYYLNGRKQQEQHVGWTRRLELCPSRLRVRAATAAAAAANATAAAQMRQNALNALAHRKHGAFLRRAEMENPAHDPDRVMRNINLLNSALSIIREMDPAYLEILCYAIHDQVSSNEFSN